MAIRNAVPRFGIRWAVVLAVVAAVVVAALLAVGSPASAQSSDDKEIWSATMTVGAQSGGTGRGYINVGVASDYGSLDDTTFTFDGTNYTIAIINDVSGYNGAQVFAMSPKPSDPEAAAWTFHMGGRTYNLADGLVVDDGSLRGYQFRNQGRIGWSDNDEVAVKLTALPIIVVDTDGRDVEYGGNNNAAESTAIFWFTRTGNTDEALSFTLLHVQSGETATRTFKAGQSEFFNAHWAVDVDESNNPVCLITWTIVEPVPGYIVYQFGDAVLVEGPGTTCMSGM